MYNERRNLAWSIRSGRRMSCASVHMWCAVYRRKWFRSLSSASQITIKKSGHSYSDFAAWFARCVTGKTPPDRHLKCTFQMTHRAVIWRTHGPKYHLSNFNSKCTFWIQNYALCSRVKTVEAPCVRSVIQTMKLQSGAFTLLTSHFYNRDILILPFTLARKIAKFQFHETSWFFGW